MFKRSELMFPQVILEKVQLDMPPLRFLWVPWATTRGIWRSLNAVQRL